MKVKNIMFSGFMAVVLAGVCGTASAADNMTGDALIVASKGYVDAKVKTLDATDTELSGKITALENENKEGGSVATAIAAAQTAADNAQSDVNTLAGKMNLDSADSDLSQALATKEDAANKLDSSQIDLLNTDGTVNKDAVNALVGNDTKFPTVGATVEIANAKAQQVLENVNSVSANLGTLTSKVDEHTVSIQKLEGGEGVTGSVANAIKQSKDYADSLATNYDAAGSAADAEAAAKAYADGLAGNYDASGSAATAESNAKGYADGLVAAEKERAELAEQGLQTAIDAITNGDTGALAKAKEYADGLVTAEANRADAAEKANAQAIADEKSRAEGEESRIEGLITAEESRAMGVEQGLQNSINAINDEADGIYAKAMQYTDAGLAKLYSNASECITNSKSKHCIMSAHADDSGNPVYVWIDLTAPAN